MKTFILYLIIFQAKNPSNNFLLDYPIEYIFSIPAPSLSPSLSYASQSRSSIKNEEKENKDG